MTRAHDKQWFGFNPPFFGGQQGVLSRQAGIRLVQNDLQQLILTLPGERIMRPTFGTPLRALIFDNVTEDDLVVMSEEIIKAINIFDTRVNAKVTYEIDEENHIARFYVSAQMKDGEPDNFTLVLEI